MEDIKNFTQGIDKMIELSGRSREHVSRSVKKYFNLSVSEYINKLRLNYAANLLLNSNMSIIDISFACGFQNLGYFYRTFKEQYDLTPANFKKIYSKI